MAVAFVVSALLHFKGGCTAPDGEAWVGCSKSDGLAGSLFQWFRKMSLKSTGLN